MSTPEATPRPASYDADYIIVGSGAGGGTLAARLAEYGFQVLLLEAGGDPRTSPEVTAARPWRARGHSHSAPRKPRLEPQLRSMTLDALTGRR